VAVKAVIILQAVNQLAVAEAVAVAQVGTEALKHIMQELKELLDKDTLADTAIIMMVVLPEHTTVEVVEAAPAIGGMVVEIRVNKDVVVKEWLQI
jgi:hypothetical protein